MLGWFAKIATGRHDKVKLNGSIDFIYGGMPASLRSLDRSDVTAAYVDGLNGEKRFLETTPDKVTLQGQTEYVNGIIQGESTAICGLWCKGELAGTAGVQNLHAKEGQDVTIGIFIFNKSFLGKGWGKVLVWAICRHLLDEEKIQVIRAAAKVENIASTASFLNVGFKVCTNDGIYNHMVFNAEDLIKPDKVQF